MGANVLGALMFVPYKAHTNVWGQSDTHHRGVDCRGCLCALEGANVRRGCTLSVQCKVAILVSHQNSAKPSSGRGKQVEKSIDAKCHLFTVQLVLCWAGGGRMLMR